MHFWRNINPFLSFSHLFGESPDSYRHSIFVLIRTAFKNYLIIATKSTMTTTINDELCKLNGHILLSERFNDQGIEVVYSVNKETISGFSKTIDWLTNKLKIISLNINKHIFLFTLT